MADEPTAWENNPVTVSAQRPAQHSRSLALTEARKVFRNELTACLTLVAPVGMTEESRRDWLAVAWDTLKHIPPDILTIGASKARRLCDHPSKIVPTIIAQTTDLMRWQRNTRAAPVALIEPRYVSPEEARAILNEVGLKPRFPSNRQVSMDDWGGSGGKQWRVG
jgi:hypothetical protein